MPDINNGTMEIELGLKAFALSMARIIAKDPSVIDALEVATREKGTHLDWTDLKKKLSDPVALARFSENIDLDANNTEWTRLDQAAEKWAKYGWVIGDPLFKLDLWENIPQSQQEADKAALHYISKNDLFEIWQETSPIYANHRHIFTEACSCFENKCYTACASLLISLIDGTLISSKANTTQTNRKTGSVAQKRVSTEILKDDVYRLPSHFHWELINFDTYINNLFEHANNFADEPQRINRNFLHHGMSKRKVLRKDCVKLFIAYKHVLSYCTR